MRLVLVHARDEHAKAFHLHHGFIESPIDSLTLMMLLPSGTWRPEQPGRTAATVRMSARQAPN